MMISTNINDYLPFQTEESCSEARRQSLLCHQELQSKKCSLKKAVNYARAAQNTDNQDERIFGLFLEAVVDSRTKWRGACALKLTDRLFRYYRNEEHQFKRHFYISIYLTQAEAAFEASDMPFLSPEKVSHYRTVGLEAYAGAITHMFNVEEYSNSIDLLRLEAIRRGIAYNAFTAVSRHLGRINYDNLPKNHKLQYWNYKVKILRNQNQTQEALKAAREGLKFAKLNNLDTTALKEEIFFLRNCNTKCYNCIEQKFLLVGMVALFIFTFFVLDPSLRR